MNPVTDLKPIQDLLRENKLPYQDLEESQVAFITKEKQGKLVGCIGLETYGPDGLLRSLAVSDLYKGTGIGKQLLDALYDASRSNGIQRLHLLTTTADTYFKRYGFIAVERSQAPKKICETREFSNICPSSAVYMVLELR